MIRVYGLKKKLEGRTYEFSEVINSSLVEALQFPENKKAQRFIKLEEDEFYKPEGRSDNYTVLEISMMLGRKEDTKKNLIKTLFRKFNDELSIDNRDLEIIITEQPGCNWGFRGMTGDEAKLCYKVEV